MARALSPLCLAAALACGDDGGPDGVVDDGTDQRPPSDPARVGAWIDSGAYLTWECESAPAPAEGVSPHRSNRVCWNEALVAARGGTGDWPEGATAVKESYSGETITDISVETRDGVGAEGWFYWRRESNGTVTNGATRTGGQGFCVGCHTGAPRDFVWDAGGATGG